MNHLTRLAPTATAISMRKPHIVLVATGGTFWLGGLQYTQNIIEALTRFGDEFGGCDVSVLVREQASLASFEHLGPRLRQCVYVEDVQQPYTLPRRIKWRAKRQALDWVEPRLDEALSRLGATFAYPHCSRHVASADWIADFQYHHHPEKMSKDEIHARAQQFGYAVKNAMRIVLSSANAEKDCHQIFPETVDRTDVLPFRVFPVADWLACDPLDVIRKYRLPARYLLISNWMLPTKNHNFALDALTKIANRERESMHIVCTGDVYDYRNPGFYNQFMNKVHLLGLRNCVSHLGVIPKIDQISLLRGATAYLQPSLFEGWNTGVEEAHLFGKQVLLSDIPVHREQNPPGAIYFNPHVPDDLAARLREVFGAPRGGSSAFSVEAEQAALSSYETLQRDFARTFLMIADRAMTHSRAQM